MLGLSNNLLPTRKSRLQQDKKNIYDVQRRLFVESE